MPQQRDRFEECELNDWVLFHEDVLETTKIYEQRGIGPNGYYGKEWMFRRQESDVGPVWKCTRIIESV